MTVGKPISQEKIKALLSAPAKTRGAPKPKATLEPREYSVWWKLNQEIREEGCTNPNCVDPRPKTDAGTNIVVHFGDHYMCRFCFLDGWLSPNKPPQVAS